LKSCLVVLLFIQKERLNLVNRYGLWSIVYGFCLKPDTINASPGQRTLRFSEP
jgi:hypothetical protein